jgi:amino acid transporter
MCTGTRSGISAIGAPLRQAHNRDKSQLLGAQTLASIATTNGGNAGLAKGALGTLEAAIMGVAGSAPAYSIAATTAALVAVAGVQSVGALLYCGLIMFGIVLAYARLSAAMPDAGAGFTWVGRIFGPGWGFMAGWGLLISAVVFTVSATVPAAQATLKLVAPELVDKTGWVAAVGALWFTIITAITARGIKHASYVQIAFTIVETVIIAAIVVQAFRVYGGSPAHIPSFDWVSPFAFTPPVFATSALIAIFFYWGWDVTASLAEETRDGDPPPASRGVIWSMISLMLFFILMMTVVLIVLTDKEIAAAETNTLFAVAEKLFPGPWAYLAVLSTLLSTIGTIETQVLQLSRSLFAMGRADMLNARYAQVHGEWQTPLTATAVQWGFGILFLYGSSYLPSVGKILESSISAIGLQICFYMSLAGFACAWFFRDKLRSGVRDAMTYVIWPAGAAVFMVFIAIWSVPTFDAVTLLVGVGGLAIGLIPLVMARRVRNPVTV